MEQNFKLTRIIEKKSHELQELQMFAGVCGNALEIATRSVEAIDLRRRIAEFLDEELEEKTEHQLNTELEYATKVSEFAETQRKQGLPYLYSLCVVRLWSLLEALVDELVVHSLLQPKDFFDQTVLSKLKGPLIEFRAASQDEQAEFLTETLKQSVDAPLKLGAGKFEALLAPVGLGGNINEGIRKIFYELSQIRNVIVHKSGKADRRLLESCTWLSAQKNDPINVTHNMFRRYHKAALWYLICVRGRVDARYGTQSTGDIKTLLNMIEAELCNMPDEQRP